MVKRLSIKGGPAVTVKQVLIQRSQLNTHADRIAICIILTVIYNTFTSTPGRPCTSTYRISKLKLYICVYKFTIITGHNSHNKPLKRANGAAFPSRCFSNAIKSRRSQESGGNTFLIPSARRHRSSSSLTKESISGGAKFGRPISMRRNE